MERSINDILIQLEKQHLSFKLGEEQREVLLQVFNYINEKNISALNITGFAGVGKSSLTKLITRYLEQKQVPYVLASPTHKAKNVLAQYTERDATTIHKLLNLSAVVDILELDYKDLQFASKTKDSSIPRNGVLIVDECSMINDTLYDFIIEKATDCNCLIIWVGDSKQLAPVKSRKLSKTFTDNVSLELTKVYRQKGDNPILDILDTLRERPLKQFPSIQSEGGNLTLYNDWKHFIQTNRELFVEAIKNKDPTFVKLLAYTNRRVEAFNQVIRKELFLDLEEYNEGDFLIGYDNCEYKADFTRLSAEITNSSDYIVRVAQSGQKTICGHVCKGWFLKLFSCDFDEEFEVFVLSKNNSENVFQILALQLEGLRIEAVNAAYSSKKLAAMKWREYFKLMHSFLIPFDLSLMGRIVRKKSIDYGYCTTTHKAQGSNYQHTLIDMDNILLASGDELRQLQYVSLSRTRKDVHMLIK